MTDTGAGLLIRRVARWPGNQTSSHLAGIAAAAASDPETTKASAAAKAGAEPVGRQVEREEPRRDYSGNPRRDHAYPGNPVPELLPGVGAKCDIQR